MKRSLIAALSVTALFATATPANASAKAGSVCDMTNNTAGCPGSTEGEPEAIIEMIVGSAPSAPMAEPKAGSVCELSNNTVGCPGSTEGEPEALIGS